MLNPVFLDRHRRRRRRIVTAAFDSRAKRSIAVRLIAAGEWTSAQWTALSQIVYNDCVGMLPDGTLITRKRPRRKLPDTLSLAEAAGIAGVHPATIRRWVKSGKLTASPGEKTSTIRRDDLERFLEHHRSG
ncbi:MAG TPA: helix-turn-helix domain-containing protein [Armatimonadota bacterium]|nr:helix-turn-helix domain-containing protein [Armatimonadota bacterium]HPO71695.1 helix-turn-helix domain-containing protein [Armatimonadota bacterium]